MNQGNDDLREILGRLDRIRDEAKPAIVDPTANVLGLVAAAIARQDDLRQAEFKRQDDLRVQAEHYHDKLAAERLRTDREAKQAESGRIDSLLAADKANVALALAKQEAQAQAQDKRIAALEQNQYQGVGAGAARGEGRQQNQWLIGVVIGVIVALASIFSRLLGK